VGVGQMATLRDIKRKINAVKKTRQITRAMNMVAAAKLRKVQGKTEGFAPYATKFKQVMANLSSRVEQDIHPLLIQRDPVSKVELMVFTADRGLCGSFNNNLITRAEKWIKALEAKGVKCSLICIGKKARDYFTKRGYNVTESHVYVYGKVDIAFINDMTRRLINRYLSGEIDEVHMLHMEFVSMAKQIPKFVKLIPIESAKEDEVVTSVRTEYLFEPSPEELLVELLPKHISVQIFNAFLQNETSEHAARMAAMDTASKNCGDLINTLTLVFNKARQASITAELMDIVGGAEALRKA